MKKLLTYFSLIVAIASFGGLIATANAQSISPSEAAELQATLNSVSAELATLQAQAKAQTNGSASVPTVAPTITVTVPTTVSATLSPADAAAVNTALSSLVSALSGLETAIANNPQVATTNAPGISVALQGIGKTLLAITTTINGGTVASGPALAQNSTGAASGGSATAQAGTGTSGNGSIAAANPPSTAGSGSGIAPSTVSNGNTAPAANTAPATVPAAAQTAQASSAFSLTNIRWPYVVAGILVILAVALWLFWPGEGEDKKNVAKKSGGAPSKPAPAAQSPQMTILASSGKPIVPPQPMQQTPLSSAVSASAQRTETTAGAPKVVPPQPTQQQRKPA